MDTSIDQDITNGALTEVSRTHLKSAGGWSLFLAILGFIGCGLMFLGGLVFAFSFSSNNFPAEFPFPPVLFSLVYIVLAVIYAIPSYNLFLFSRRASAAASSAENSTLEETLNYLKKFFKSVGIMTIVLISLYVIVLIGAVVIGASSAF